MFLFFWRVQKLFDSTLTGFWKNTIPGGFMVLPALFFFSGFSPLYYDLIITGVIDFPLNPKVRKTLIAEKFTHLFFENIASICITGNIFFMKKFHDEFSVRW